MGDGYGLPIKFHPSTLFVRLIAWSPLFGLPAISTIEFPLKEMQVPCSTINQIIDKYNSLR